MMKKKVQKSEIVTRLCKLVYMGLKQAPHGQNLTGRSGKSLSVAKGHHFVNPRSIEHPRTLLWC